MEIVFPTLAEMKKWLVTTSGVILTSVTLMQDVKTLEIQVQSPKAFYQSLEYHTDLLPEGQYLVKYREITDDETSELDYSKMAFAISFSANLNDGSNRKIGGFNELSKALLDFETCYVINKADPAYLIARFFIVEPSNPKEINDLKEALANYAVIYGFNDGTGTINLANTKMGKGIYADLS